MKNHGKIKNINDLKSIFRKELIINIIKYTVIAAFAFLLAFYKPTLFIIVTIFLILSLTLTMIQGYTLLKKIITTPKVDDSSDIKIGNFTSSELIQIVDDLKTKMNTCCAFEVKIISDEQYQAWTSKPIFKLFFKNKDIIGIHAGLLRILSKHELKAVIAHEIGHHLAPKLASQIMKEYWADFYSCKYYDPVAMANALIKIDKNTFLYNVYINRCAHLANILLNKKSIDKKFNDYVTQNAPVPLESKRSANNSAKKIVHSYICKNNIQTNKMNFVKKLCFVLNSKLSGDILNRKRLSKLRYINWLSFDSRIRDRYLDKYELIQSYKVIKNRRMTINRLFFFDFKNSTHPNVNRRLLFIIENFLLPDDYSYERLFNRATEKKLNL